jgi:hypothetical protein
VGKDGRVVQGYVRLLSNQKLGKLEALRFFGKSFNLIRNYASWCFRRCTLFLRILNVINYLRQLSSTYAVTTPFVLEFKHRN